MTDMRRASPAETPSRTQATTFANGLTLWLRPHARPARMVAAGLVLHAGSLYEARAERGYSHLIEHLAFRGGTRLAAGELNRFLSAQGARPGREHNAFTSFDHTSYMLVLRQAEAASLATALAWLADVAYGLVLDPLAIEAERRIVIEEMRHRRRAAERIHARLLRAIAPTLAASRPLGRRDSLRDAIPDTLREYYERYYRPERATLVIAGDVDCEAALALARDLFAAWPRGERSAPVTPQIVGSSRCSYICVADDECEEEQLRAIALCPHAIGASPADLRGLILADAAAWTASRRLLLSLPALSFHQATLTRDGMQREVRLPAPASALPARARALGRALRTAEGVPVTSAELALIRARLAASARRAAHNARNVETEGLFAALMESALSGRPPADTDERIAITRELARGLSRGELQAGLTRTFLAHLRTVAWVASAGRKQNTARRIREAFELGLDDPPHALPRVRSQMLFPATSLTRRRRVRIERDRAHTIDHIALSNGIRAHVRSMRDGRDRVHLVLTLPGGRICEGERQLGLTSAAALLFTRPATRGAATHEIRDYLADKEITLECEVDEDALRLDLSADRADFEDGLRLLQALLTEPRLGEDALALWRERLRVMHSAPHLPIDRVLATAALSLLTGNDPRFRLITARRAASIARRAAEAWLGRLIARAPIEIGLCGDITLAAARRLIERHFSGLPRRAASTAAFSHLRRLDIRNGPLEIEKHAALARGQAAFLLGWRAVPWQAMTERRLLQMACEILNARLHAEIRERQGLTYEIGAHYSPSRAYPQASLLSISCLIAPRTLAHALRDVRRLVEQFAALGPRETETRAVARHYAALTERARGEPRHWARMLAEIETRGLDLDDILHLPQFLRSVKAEDLRRTFAAVAVDANRLQVICRPR